MVKFFLALHLEDSALFAHISEHTSTNAWKRMLTPHRLKLCTQNPQEVSMIMDMVASNLQSLVAIQSLMSTLQDLQCHTTALQSLPQVREENSHSHKQHFICQAHR